MTHLVYAVTLNWNGKYETLQCLKSLSNCNYSNLKIVVVDNNSADDSIEEISLRFPEVKILANSENLGYSEGLNRGIEYSFSNGAENVLIINNDAIIDSNSIDELVKISVNEAKVGFVTGKIYFKDNPKKLQKVGKGNHPLYIVGPNLGKNELDVGQYDKITEYDFVDDVMLLVTKNLYETIGAYNPEFFFLYEETDWCIRARKAGFKIFFTPNAKAWHSLSASGGGPKNVTSTFFWFRNRILFQKFHSNNKQWSLFIIYLFPNILKSFIFMFSKNQISRILPMIKGTLSGFKWLVAYEKPTNN